MDSQAASRSASPRLVGGPSRYEEQPPLPIWSTCSNVIGATVCACGRRAPSTRSLGGGAGCGPLCATRIGPSYTTCAGPDQNGARSTRAALGGRAGRTCDPPNTPRSKMRRETLAAEVIQLRLDRCASLDAILSVLRDTESA